MTVSRSLYAALALLVSLPAAALTEPQSLQTLSADDNATIAGGYG